MEKDAFYFPHFSNARNDKRIKRLRKELGIEGYGLYFMILETLREEAEFKYPISDIDLLADDYNTSEAKVRTVITNYGLFQVDEKENFFSAKFNGYLQPYIKMKEQRKNAIESRWAKYRECKELQDNTDTTVLRPYYDQSTVVIQSKVKESKVKESKVNESKVNKPLVVPEHLVDVWPYFLEMRKSIRKPATEQAQKNIFEKLNNLAPNNTTVQIKIVNESITNSWQDVYPLRSEKKDPTDDGEYLAGIYKRLN